MRRIVTGLLISSFALSLSAQAKEELTKVRIGWQVPWATQGQLVQILKHTDILKKNGLEAEFIGRDYGPLLNELAMAGGADVILTADQPAAVLFSKSDRWQGIARLMYNRTSIYVPKMSKIKSIKDLKGKTIGVPIGAAAERTLIETLSANGLDAKKDVKIINVGIREQVPLVKDGQNKTVWGNIDALSGFDPTPAIFESEGLVRVLDVQKVVSLVLLNKGIIEKNPKAGQQLASALVDAYRYYQTNRSQANKWFMEEAKLNGADEKACDIAASIEPNLADNVKQEIRITFNEGDFGVLQKAAKFVAPNTGKEVDMVKFVTNEYSEKVK